MSSENPQNEPNRTEESPRGPNLVVVYAILAFAMIAAMAIAAVIVLPFYRHR
jgi:hypothetical protein